MADGVRRFVLRLAVDGAQQTKREIANVGEAGDRALGRIALGAQAASRALSLLGPVLAGLSVGALANFARRAVDTVGGLGELATQLGISTDALQAFRFAATEVGLSNDELERGIAALTRRIGDAAQGQSQAEAAFRRFGIAFRDANGDIRSTESVLVSIAEKIAAIPNPADRAALATEIFGDRLGQKLIPFLAQGREGLERLTAEALRYGAIADKELIDKADEASDKIAKLERSFSALATNLAARVAPVLTSVADALNNIISQTVSSRRVELENELAQILKNIETLERKREKYVAPARERGVPDEVTAQSDFRVQILNRDIERLRAQERAVRERIEAELRAAQEQQRRAQEILEGQAQRDAERRRQRAAEDIERLRETLDAKLRIERTYQEQLARIREAESAGAIDAAERVRLETQALEKRNQALAALAQRPRRETQSASGLEAEMRERENVLRALEQLTIRNETAQERYNRRLAELETLIQRAQAAGVPIPDEAVIRERTAALEELNRELARADLDAQRLADTMEQVGNAFALAFEDMIVNGTRFSDILRSLERNLLRIGTNVLIGDPLREFFRGLVSPGGQGGGLLGGLLGGIGNVFKSIFGSIFHEGGIVGDWAPQRAVPAIAFAGAPRLHAGAYLGLRSDEVPAILQRGERVLSREEVRRGAGTGNRVVVNITTPDADSFAASRAQVQAQIARAMRAGMRNT